MTDPQQGQQGQQAQQGQGDHGQAQAQQGQGDHGQAQAQQQGPVPYARFKQVNDQLAALKTQMAVQGQQQQQPAGDPDLATRLATLEQDLAKERANTLRLKVARAAGLPDDLADRLVGADEAALSADAAKLVPLLKPKGGPGVPPPPRGGSAPVVDMSSMTPAQIREARAQGQLK